MTTDEMLETMLGEERVAGLREANDRFWEDVMTELSLTDAQCQS